MRRSLIFLAAIAELSGCSFPLTPRQYFDKGLNLEIGKPFQWGPDYTLITKSKLVSSEHGPNGRDVYHFGWQAAKGICEVAIFVDPTTNTVVAAKTEGDPTPCEIVP